MVESVLLYLIHLIKFSLKSSGKKGNSFPLTLSMANSLYMMPALGQQKHWLFLNQQTLIELEKRNRLKKRKKLPI